MHTDDHILETFLASNKPLAAIASDLSITLIALVHWMDKNVDLLAVAKRAMETHIAFLALKAEAAALVDLTNVSTSTTNEERKRKSASQLLRHSAKRLLTAVGSSSSFSPQGGEKSLSTAGAKGMRGSPNAELSSTNPERKLRAPCASTSPADLLNQLACSSSSSPPSPRPTGAKGMRGSPNAELSSTNPERNLRAPCASVTPADLLHLLAPASRPNAELSSTNPERKLRAPCASASPADVLHPPASSSPNAECPMPNALSFSDHEIDVLMATLANHFNIDLATLADEPEKQPHATSASP